MQTLTAHRTLDGRGKTITTYVIHDAAASLANMAEGEILEVATDDFEPFPADIAAWCRATGHVLAATESRLVSPSPPPSRESTFTSTSRGPRSESSAEVSSPNSKGGVGPSPGSPRPA